MALGIEGTGPYGEIRTLREQIKDWKYKITLIGMGVHKGSKAKYEKYISENRVKIKTIQEGIKKR